MENSIYIILGIYLLIINVAAFAMYGVDKKRAKAGAWRIPEARLIWVALNGGSIGALLGMMIFRHKTLHPKFKYGIPAILVCHILLVAGYFWLSRKGFLV